ncbi:MAG TPA: type II secretion system F family protein [Kouleothrix sp.]|uniref:type II secretion system F family protein n=1 Tax=Kouleothrix sp. TaxID=2779161 RepID=UPI002C4839FF|nr:type II secretion system F family protein [Kouleothrix sp.]
MATQRDKQLSRRLDVYLSTGDPEQSVTLKELELSKPFRERVIFPAAQRAARLFVWMLPKTRVQALRQRLVMAGNPSNIQPTAFIGVKGLVMVLTVGMSLAFGYLTHYPATFFNMLMLGLLAFCSFALPDFWLSRRVTQRQLAIVNALPDALDLLVIANEAGLSFESAMQEITSKWDNELAAEFGRALADMRMGQARREALTALGDRTGVLDVNTFVSAVNQAESMGVSIGRVLTVQAEELRVKRRQRAQERANQAPVKMMIPLVFLIFPSIFAVLLGPAVPELLTAFGGL